MRSRRPGCLHGVGMLAGVFNLCKNTIPVRLQKTAFQSKGLNSVQPLDIHGLISLLYPVGICDFCPILMVYAPSGYKLAAAESLMPVWVLVQAGQGVEPAHGVSSIPELSLRASAHQHQAGRRTCCGPWHRPLQESIPADNTSSPREQRSCEFRHWYTDTS